MGQAESYQNKQILLRIIDLKQYFPVRKKSIRNREPLYLKANDGISLDIYEGETFGLVGESGCGKSTFGRVLLQLYRQTGGRTLYYGRSVRSFDPAYFRGTIQDFPKLHKKWEQMGKEKRQGEREKLTWDLAEVVGGLLTADDPETVSKALFKEYQLSRQGEDSPALKEARQAVETLRQTYQGKEHFSTFEAMRTDGIDLTRLTYQEMRMLRKDLQLVFQDPYSSLNPRMTVGQIIGEGLIAHGIFQKDGEETQTYITQVMEECGLSSYMIHRYPHQFSGGQRQRIGIARSLALRPKFVVCDEAVSALDVSIQSQVINLLLDLKEKERLTYLFISHDLSVIKYISDRVGVMYLGALVELSGTSELFEHPLHPYTEALLSAIPTVEDENGKETILLEGEIPSPIHPPSGCRFHTRCRYKTKICEEIRPELEEKRPGHFAACHHSGKLLEKEGILHDV